MPITTEILYKLATKAGSAGNSQAQADPNASLGKYVSTTAFVTATLGNLFDAVTGDENAGEAVDYRCLFIHNSHSTLTLIDPKLWITGQEAGGADAAIGLDPTAASAVGASSAQAVEIADESTAPAGVSFSAPSSKGAGLSVGDLGPGEVRAFWIRRTATDSAPKNDDGVSFRVEGDTEQ